MSRANIGSLFELTLGMLFYLSSAKKRRPLQAAFGSVGANACRRRVLDYHPWELLAHLPLQARCLDRRPKACQGSCWEHWELVISTLNFLGHCVAQDCARSKVGTASGYQIRS